ncbi:helix-turn-helix domain-containing protein [Streptomyces sp. IBSBF 2807]|nr:helix-turn-helix domain-containing protein [Streptomyces hilarionis]
MVKGAGVRSNVAALGPSRSSPQIWESSRATASKWVDRHRHHGELGLHDSSSTPVRQPAATAPDMVVRIEKMRRTDKWSAARIAHELAADETRSLPTYDQPSPGRPRTRQAQAHRPERRHQP